MTMTIEQIIRGMYAAHLDRQFMDGYEVTPLPKFNINLLNKGLVVFCDSTSETRVSALHKALEVFAHETGVQCFYRGYIIQGMCRFEEVEKVVGA